MYGYYPFGKDVTFEIELNQVINQTMENDIPQYANMNVSTGRKLKQLLMIISKSVPFKPVMQKLADIIGVSRNYLSDYLLYIEKAGMIAQVRDATGGIRGLGKVEKIYLDNTNLIYILGGENSNIGNIRETFFYNISLLCFGNLLLSFALSANFECPLSNLKIRDFGRYNILFHPHLVIKECFAYITDIGILSP